ncbi:trigger factor [Rhodospirillaceae bacterium KN72]|uniref:Trigger factor n=1 Tax=Pacificispira spongiicola TaxID=2729598 RepID=A0A7Y0E2L5_9PROT|nr:trigger factor [Pacificispira spongiicola]NMM46046.1 trigger factor [Pacificispira spongiicola]
MQVVETKNEGLSREFTITVGADEIDQKVGAKLEEVGQTVKMPGFRPGKVPMKILRQRFGSSVLGEVLEKTVGESSQSALVDRELKPAMQPKIEITSFEEGQDLVYTMAVEIMPAITPVDFGTLELTRYKPEITDEEVQNALDELAKNNRATSKIEKDRKTQSGDVVMLNFKGFVDGEAFQGGEAEDFRLELGSGQFIPGFEDQLIGQKAGEDMKVTVTFPEEYGAAHLAGKEAIFECKINEIHEYTDRELNDDFAKELGLESLDDLRDQMRQRIESEYADLARARTKRELLDVLFDKHDFEVPPGMVQSEFDQIWEQFAKAKEEGQVDDEDKDKDEEVLKSEYRDIAKRRVLLGLLLAHVGDEAKIQISQEELQKAVFEQARRYPGQERQVFEYYTQNPEMMASLRAPLFEEKTVDYILELAKVNDLALPVDKLLESDDDGDEKPKKAAGKKAAAKKSTSKKGAAKKAAAKKDAD